RSVRGLPYPTGNNHPKILPACVASGAEETLHGPPRQARKALEILCCRRARARVLGRLHACVRGCDKGHRIKARAMVRGASRQQVVHSTFCRCGNRRSRGETRPHIPENRRRKKEGACSRARGTRPRITSSACERVKPGRRPSYP